MVSEQSTESSDPMEITQYMNMVSTSFGKQMLALNLVANKLAIFRHKKLSWKEHPLVLFFIGPTGVGKTELAKTIAIAQNASFTCFDMSNLVNEQDAVKFYGQFTSFIASNPKGIVLFDEMDKVDPRVFDFLLRVCDEGEVTDITNRKLECKEAVFIMTGNVGLTTITQFQNQVPKIQNIFESDEGEAELTEFRCKFQDSIRQELRNLFRKDFIYRINEVIPFFDFTKDNVLELYKYELEKGCKIFSFDDLIVSWIVQHYHQDDKGAACVHDTVQNIVNEKIARLMIRLPNVTKLHLSIDYKTNKLIISPVEFDTEKQLRSKL